MTRLFDSIFLLFDEDAEVIGNCAFLPEGVVIDRRVQDARLFIDALNDHR